VYKVLVGKPEKKRPLVRPRHRWEYGIRIDLRGIAWGSIDWILLVQDRDRWPALVNLVINLWVLMPHSSDNVVYNPSWVQYEVLSLNLHSILGPI
jgi:hypothetical protein